MGQAKACGSGGWAFLGAMVWLVTAVPSEAVVANRGGDALEQKRLFRPTLSMAMRNVPLAEVMDRLPNRAAWEAFTRARAAEGATFHAYIDPGTGTVRDITRTVPLIPGSGVGNRVTVQALGQRLGRAVHEVDAAAVADVTLAFVRQHQALLGVDPEQLGPARAARVTSDLWHVAIPQRYRGIPVRDSVLVAGISHGNLVTIGADGWGNVTLLDVTPTVAAATAEAVGFAHAEGRTPEDEVKSPPVLEIVGDGAPAARGVARDVGRGYTHRLVWSFVFRRRPSVARWEVMVDAHSGEVVSFQDLNHYAKRQVTGGVYPYTNTETCPDPATCGAMQAGWPMPFADTGFPAPNDMTNSAGVFDFTSGAGATTLSGRYITIRGHAPLSEASSAGVFLLGGTNGQHDLEASGSSAGNTAAARTTYYELNKSAEIARGYLPYLETLQGPPVVAFVNENDTCNAYYEPEYLYPGTFHFFRSGPYGRWSCGNTGELASVVAHEWGHWLDDHDSNGGMSGTAYADIAAVYRTQVSCVGTGFFQDNAQGCGFSPDGTGVNVDMGLLGGRHCATQCSGARDADWEKHEPPAPDAPPVPDDVLGFVCSQCVNGDFEINDECASAPAVQAAWDLVTRDLTAAPFNLSRQSAFMVGNKLFHQGSGDAGPWYTFGSGLCDGPSSGCAAHNGYKAWITADDDNGNLNDGTPHMTAIYNAFKRHGIACDTPSPVNSGCAAGPASGIALTATPGHYKVDLSWNGVAGATRYWVFRSEGQAGCDSAKALIAEVTSLGYTDTEVAAFRPYCYNVVAAGVSEACYSRLSTSATVTPTAGSYTVSCAPSSLTVPMGGSASTSCSATSTGGYASAVSLLCSGLPPGASCNASPSSATLNPNGSVTSTVTVSAGAFARGAYTFQVRGTPAAAPPVTHAAQMQLTVRGPDDLLAAYDPTLRAPVCATVGASCDTGSLVIGRGQQGPEPNQPNTLQASCPDGNAQTAGFVDHIKVSTADGTPFATGSMVSVTATIRTSLAADDVLDFFHADDAAAPGWVLFASRAPGSGTQTFAASYTLPRGALQAVRVQYRRGGGAIPCSAGTSNDRDDLVFAVQ
jgi:trimeric autotransporter adhesin